MQAGACSRRSRSTRGWATTRAAAMRRCKTCARSEDGRNEGRLHGAYTATRQQASPVRFCTVHWPPLFPNCCTGESEAPGQDGVVLARRDPQIPLPPLRRFGKLALSSSWPAPARSLDGGSTLSMMQCTAFQVTLCATLRLFLSFSPGYSFTRCGRFQH